MNISDMEQTAQAFLNLRDQQKLALVEIMSPDDGIAWNLVSLREIL